MLRLRMALLRAVIRDSRFLYFLLFTSFSPDVEDRNRNGLPIFAYEVLRNTA